MKTTYAYENAQRVLLFSSIRLLKEAYPEGLPRDVLFSTENTYVRKHKNRETERASKIVTWQNKFLDLMVRFDVLVQENYKYSATQEGLAHIEEWLKDEENLGGSGLAFFAYPKTVAPPLWIDEKLEKEGSIEVELNIEERQVDKIRKRAQEQGIETATEVREIRAEVREIRAEDLGPLLVFVANKQEKLETSIDNLINQIDELTRAQNQCVDIVSKTRKKSTDIEKRAELVTKSVDRIPSKITEAVAEGVRLANEDIEAIVNVASTQTVTDIKNSINELVERSKKKEQETRDLFVYAIKLIIDDQKNTLAAFEALFEQLGKTGGF